MEFDPIETYKKGNEVVKIFTDPDPESPRNWDNFGTMVCSHSRYILGDKQIDYDFGDYLEQEELKPSDLVMLELWLYDHSGITMKSSECGNPYSDQWDSGMVGLIYVTKEKIKTEFGVKRITKKTIEKAKEYLRQDVKTYDQYLMGEIYGYQSFVIEKVKVVHNDGKTETEKREIDGDSCWGYFSIDDIKSELGIDNSWNED